MSDWKCQISCSDDTIVYAWVEAETEEEAIDKCYDATYERNIQDDTFRTYTFDGGVILVKSKSKEIIR
jgi:hypothetical protein